MCFHGTDTMTIIKKPDPLYETTMECTFDPLKVKFRVNQGKVKGVEYDRFSRGKTSTYIYLPMVYYYTTKQLNVYHECQSPETIPNRTWKEFYHGPNPSFAEPLPFKADWEDSVSYEPSKLFNITHGEDYQYKRKDKVEIVIHPRRVNTKHFRLNLMEKKQ